MKPIKFFSHVLICGLTLLAASAFAFENPFGESLKKVGIESEFGYKGEYVSNFDGGIKRDTAYLGNADIKAVFDLDMMLGLKDVVVSLYGLGTHGDDPTEFIGDSFATSNIEAPNTFKLYEAFLTKKLDDRLTIDVGLRDLNAIYYVTETSGYFINSAFGISPSLSQTGVNGPSIFPITSLAMNFSYVSPAEWYFNAGVFNAQSGDPNRARGTRINTSNSEGHLVIAESGRQSTSETGAHKYAIGAWTYNKEADRTDTSGKDTNSGFYFLFDRQLSSRASVFVRHGMAQSTINTFETATELGAAFKGLLPGREEDVFVVGFAHVQVADDYSDANSSQTSESVYELGYSVQVSDNLTIMPDYQYVINPGLDKSLDNASVGTIRFNVSF